MPLEGDWQRAELAGQRHYLYKPMRETVTTRRHGGATWRAVLRTRSFPRWSGAALIIVGLLFLAALLRYQIRLAVFGTKAVGQVVAFDPTRGGRYAPRVRVTLSDGQAIEFHGASMRGAPLVVGDMVPVYYLPNEPTFGEIATFRRFWLGVIVSSVCIVGSLGGGLRILSARRGSFAGS